MPSGHLHSRNGFDHPGHRMGWQRSLIPETPLQRLPQLVHTRTVKPHTGKAAVMPADHVFANNPLCRLLGIRYPICQAGMYQVAYGPLAAAVSNAGGLGVIGSAYMPPTRLREEIRIAK